MSEKLCTLRTKGGGGGRYTETSLWTNASPTSSFAAQDVTLSDSIDNYKYIAIKYKFDTSSNVEGSVIFLVSDIKKSVQGVDTIVSCIGASPQGIANYARRVFYTSNTKIRIETATAMNKTGTSTAYVIPLEILGLNELDHAKGFDESVLWTNNAPTTARSGTNTITLSESYQNYDFVKITYNYTTTDIAPNYMSILVAPKDLYGANGRPTIALSRTNASGNYVQVRHISSNSYTTITDTLDVSAQSTSCIIINIVGCKFR